ncbi:MAG TPA: hypothetical protein V6D03_02535 [Candidatus Caenarcaniphilales bacterium]
MLKQMCWLPVLGPDGDKILHLRTEPNQPWRPYTAYPSYAVPDSTVPKGSQGWTTYQKLVRSGWTLVSSAQTTRNPFFVQELKRA